MICGLLAEVMEQLMQTAGHLKATYRVARAPQESAKVQQGYRESQRSFWRKWPAASEIQTGHTRALTNFPNQLRWS